MDREQQDKKYFLNTYKRVPLDVVKGEGVWLVDRNGKRYLDFFSGLGVNALGFSHPAIIKAVTEQINKFAHLSNSFVTDVQIEFAEKLLRYSGMSRVFLTNSGTESVEAAIKLVRKKMGADKIIYSLSNGFHGRTYGAMTLTGKEKYTKGFEPLLPNIRQVKFNDVEDLKTKADGNTAAIFVEFIQGEGGINPVSAKFVEALKELRNKFHFCIVADEIQAGIGRTGKAFAFNHFDIEPDIVVAAKAIGGGLPLGAVLTSEGYNDVFSTGIHGTTFGGNPVSCAAGLAVLREVFEKRLMEKVNENGNYFIEELNKLKEKYPDDIADVRGKGYMIGIELKYEGFDTVGQFLNKNILINCTNMKVLRLLPPLTLGKEHIDHFISTFKEILEK